MEGSNYGFVYDNMAPSDTVNDFTARFTCGYAEACSSDADCDSGYCSKSTCAAVKPTLKYPYVQYQYDITVADLPDDNKDDEYNSSIVARSVSAVIVAVIVAIVI